VRTGPSMRLQRVDPLLVELLSGKRDHIVADAQSSATGKSARRQRAPSLDAMSSPERGQAGPGPSSEAGAEFTGDGTRDGSRVME